MRAMRNFCSPRLQPPGLERTEEGARCFGGQEFVQSPVATLSTYSTLTVPVMSSLQAASCRVRARGKMLQRQSVDALQSCPCGNIKIFNKDVTHAARRVMTRTVYKDEKMKHVLKQFLAVAHRIQHSQVFSERFQKNIETTEADVGVQRRIKNLRSVKHRHESLQKPLGRSVLFIKAFLLTAEQIANERADKVEGRECADFLMSDLDEENLLLLAGMADASDETMIVIRHTDTENLDSSELESEVQNFVSRIKILFEDGLCWKSGYLEYMCHQLLTPMVVLVRGQAISVGGSRHPSAAVKASVLARFKNWCRLARSVVDAEFCNFDLKMAFSVFNIEPLVKKNHTKDAVNNTEKLRRIAKCLDLDFFTLKAEYFDHLPIATRIAKHSDVTNVEAWKRTIAETSGSGERKAQRHPTTALLPALQRFAAFGFTTAGVEHLFAQQKMTLGEHRDNNDLAVFDELILAFDCKGASDAEDAALIEGAQQEWAAIYKDARTAVRRTRLDAGVPRQPQVTSKGNCSESRWIAKRRKGVLRLKRSARVDPDCHNLNLRAARLAPTLWTASHDKEIKFQHAKRQNNLLDAIRSKCTLPKEENSNILKQLKADDQHKEKLKKQYAALRSRQLQALQLPDRPTLADKGLYIEFDIPTLNPREVAARIRALCMRRVCDRARADVFLVECLKDIPNKIRWASTLTGGTIVTPSFLLGMPLGGGPALVYKRALDHKRSIWMSLAFEGKHSVISQMIKTMLRQTSTRWSLLASKDNAIRMGRKRAKTGNDAELLVLVTEDEQSNDDEISHIKFKLTASDALMFLSNIDLARSARGLGAA